MAYNLVINSGGNSENLQVDVVVNGVQNVFPADVPFDLEPFMGGFPPNYLYLRPLNGELILDVDTGNVSSFLSFNVDGLNQYSALPSSGAQGWPALGEVFVTVSGSTGVAAPFNRAYLVSQADVAEFGSITLIDPQGGFDNSAFVIALMAMPFKIPDGVLGDDTNIIIGELETEISVPYLTTDLITIPLGNIEVLDLADNSADYVAATYELVLPYIPDTVSIDPEFVVGKVLSVDYVLDVYSGDITVNIYNGGNTPFHSIKSTVGRSIPFKSATTLENVVGTIQGANNSTTTAYLRVARRVLQTGNFSNFVSKEGLLGLETGYIRVDDINLFSKSLYSERLEIERILRDGVIIL